MVDEFKIEVSVIVPVYNVESYISKCINSLMCQTSDNYEVIIVDDGSKDSSISICKSIIGTDSRFKILHKKNGGLMSAWKYGLIHAVGTYICFVDSDDWVDSNMLEVLLKSIKENKADLVFSGYITEDGREQRTHTRDKIYIFEGDSIKKDLISQYCNSYIGTDSNPSICRWDKIYKKDILLKNIDYFNEKVSLAEDFNTNIAVLLDANKIVLLPNFTPYHYRYNPKSIVNTVNPKAFHNIYELGVACNKICVEKKFNSFVIDGFIGNIVFEEVNRICSSLSFRDLKLKNLNGCLNLCNGYYYLNCYTKVRSLTRIRLYNLFIQHKWFGLIILMNFFNRLRCAYRKK